MSKPRNEMTSRRVARIAAKVLAMKNSRDLELYEHNPAPKRTGVYWRDIRALAASCLTQAAPKSKRRA